MCFMLLVAWLQVSQGNSPVKAVFKKNGENKLAGSVIAESKCWSMLKGGLTVDESGPVDLFFEVSSYTNIVMVLDCLSKKTTTFNILLKGKLQKDTKVYF